MKAHPVRRTSWYPLFEMIAATTNPITLIVAFVENWWLPLGSKVFPNYMETKGIIGI